MNRVFSDSQKENGMYLPKERRRQAGRRDVRCPVCRFASLKTLGRLNGGLLNRMLLFSPGIHGRSARSARSRRRISASRIRRRFVSRPTRRIWPRIYSFTIQVPAIIIAKAMKNRRPDNVQQCHTENRLHILNQKMTAAKPKKSSRFQTTGVRADQRTISSRPGIRRSAGGDEKAAGYRTTGGKDYLWGITALIPGSEYCSEAASSGSPPGVRCRRNSAPTGPARPEPAGQASRWPSGSDRSARRHGNRRAGWSCR